MRRLVIIIVVLVLIGVGVCVGGSLLAPKLINKAGSTPAEAETPVAAGASVIRARGRLVPARVETLSFAESGRVGQLTVEDGDEVSVGQVVAQLDTTDLAWAVRQAEDALIAAQLTYSQTVQPAPTEDIASAEATLDSAEAALGSAQAGLVSAQANLASAQAGLISARIALTDAIAARDALGDTRAGAEAGLASAQASLASAQASLAALQAGPDADAVEQARLSWEQARNSLARMQMERDATQARSGTPGYVLEQMRLDIANLEIAVRMAEISYLQAQNADATDEALAAATASVAAAEVGVIDAQAQVDDVDDQVAQAEASIAQAEAAVAQAEAGVVQAEVGVSQAEASVQQAEASVTQAQAALDRLRAGPDGLIVAQDALGVRQAEAELERARAQLQDVEIRASFDGVVSTVAVEEGSPVAAGAPIVTIADFSGWKVETEDLDEWGVIHIATDQPVKLVFTAFDDKTLIGHIEEIDLNPTDLPSGDVAYKVTIELDEFDPLLQWGMSVRVEFQRLE
jgi:multidrug resistance efflux pump